LFRQKAEMQMTGSAGQRRVPSSFFSEYEVYIPELTKQKKIAQILNIIDCIIEKTEDAVTKLQKIESGMMHDLFQPLTALNPISSESSQVRNAYII